MVKKFISTQILFIFFALSGFAQSVVQELKGEAITNVDDVTFTEKVVVSSKSDRIFILTNSNQSLQPGDFVTVLLQGTRVLRGLIAKTQEGKAAFKTLKTYSPQLKHALKRGVSVQLLRGDESQLTSTAEAAPRIQSAEDLYSSDLILETDEKPKKQSDLNSKNVIQLGFGILQSKRTDGGNKFYNHWIFSWNYKVSTFWWFEAMYGYSSAKRFPAKDISTDLHNITFRTKYIFDLPAFSFIMPYAGLQIVAANSKEAGEGYNLNDTDGAAQSQLEKDLVKDASKIVPVVGVTFLKRFVPGWFVTLNAGTDVINIGLGIEF